MSIDARDAVARLDYYRAVRRAEKAEARTERAEREAERMRGLAEELYQLCRRTGVRTPPGILGRLKARR